MRLRAIIYEFLVGGGWFGLSTRGKIDLFDDEIDVGF